MEKEGYYDVIRSHQKSKGDKVADAAINTVLDPVCPRHVISAVLCRYRFVTPYIEVMKNGGFVIWPEHLTFQAYKEIFGSARIPQALKITVFITVVGTTLNLVVTTLLAYPLSKKSVPGRNFILMALVFTMIFSGGIIPLYIMVRSLGLYDSVWALVIPGMVSTFNLLIVKTYFENLPAEVEEAAKVDGCSEYTDTISHCPSLIGAYHGYHWFVLRSYTLERIFQRYLLYFR